MEKIDWNNTAESIVNQVRAFNPAPVAFATYLDMPFKIYEAKVSELKGGAGLVLKADDNLVIGCGDKSVSLLKVQKAGGKPMGIKEFLRGNKFVVGEEFK